ncbi:MAG: hypothetical protein V5A36_05445 [Natronomonas sp.]
MRRRTLLRAVGAGGVALSGCLSGDTDEDGEPTETNTSDTPDSEDRTDRRYEECPREVIPYEQFPADVQTEIDAALEKKYTANRVFLREAMDTEASYVSVDGEYYDPIVSADGDQEVLTLEVVRPKALPRSRPISVEHTRDGERTITIEVTADDGTVLIDKTRTLYAGGSVEFGDTTRVGTHELQVTVRTDEQIESEWTDSMRVDESHFETLVVIEPDEIDVTGTVAELGICRYDE